MQISPEKLVRAKNTFYLEGRTVADWARENSFRQDLVYAVLNGRSKCSRGESHRIAVKLGLKPPVICHVAEECTTQ
ncbi:MAG: DNA-binding protein [Hylemonella sp.]